MSFFILSPNGSYVSSCVAFLSKPIKSLYIMAKIGMDSNLSAVYNKLKSCADEINNKLQEKVKNHKAKFIYTNFAVDAGILYMDYSIQKDSEQHPASMNIVLNSSPIDAVVERFSKQWNL